MAPKKSSQAQSKKTKEAAMAPTPIDLRDTFLRLASIYHPDRADSQDEQQHNLK